MFSELFITRARIDIADKDNNEHPYNLPVVRNNAGVSFDSPVTFIIGENGSGKSTLIEAMAIAYGFNAEGGSMNYNFSTRSTHSELSESIHLSRGIKRPREGYFFRGESFYNTKSYMEEIALSYGDKPMHDYSHGESFLVLIRERFNGNGIYIFDEPEAALSPQSQLILLTRMLRLVNDHSQFIIATHSPILLAFPNATIHQINEEGILEKVKYEDTEYYTLYKYFINNHHGFIDKIVNER